MISQEVSGVAIVSIYYKNGNMVGGLLDTILVDRYPALVCT